MTLQELKAAFKKFTAAVTATAFAGAQPPEEAELIRVECQIAKLELEKAINDMAAIFDDAERFQFLATASTHSGSPEAKAIDDAAQSMDEDAPHTLESMRTMIDKAREAVQRGQNHAAL